MKKSHLIFSVIAVIVFLTLLVLAIQVKAGTASGDIAAEIKKQEQIILQAQKDFDDGTVSEQKALDIITTAQKTIDELQNKMTDQTNNTPGLSGYAWSPNIGWISFEGVAQDGTKYQVKLDSEGYLYDNAWSSNVGFVTFDPSWGGPNWEPGTGAKYDKSTGQITGWALIDSFTNDTECDPPGTSCGNDFADGWINFSGQAQDGAPYGVTFDPATGIIAGEVNSLKNPNRWAWAGNGVGWIDFSGVTINTGQPPIGTVDLTPSPAFIGVGDTITYTCSGTGINTSIPCTATGGAGNWNGQQMSCTGDTFTTSPISPAGTYAFQIACTDTAGSPVYGNATLSVANPTPAMSLSPYCDGSLGAVKFDWSNNIASGSPCSSVPANSLWSTLPSQNSVITGLPTGTHAYSLTCTDSVNGPATASVTTECPGGTSVKKIPGYKER